MVSLDLFSYGRPSGMWKLYRLCLLLTIVELQAKYYISITDNTLSHH